MMKNQLEKPEAESAFGRPPIFYYGYSPKNNTKNQKIPGLQLPD